MSPKVERLNHLIREGYEVLDITSDGSSIEAWLRHPGAGREAVVVFTREDAARLLYEDDGPRRPLPGPRRPSKFLVTAPLR